MKIEELLEKYFDGQTTCEEERALRRFFASDQVPEHLEVYRPLFACIDQEAETFRETQKEEAAPATHPAGVRKPTRLYRNLPGNAERGGRPGHASGRRPQTHPPVPPVLPDNRHCRHSATLYRHRRSAAPHHNQSY